MPLHVTAYCKIDKDGALLNDQEIQVATDGHSFYDYSRALYHNLDLKYPKFFKMDELCQLAFLATSVLLGQEGNIDGDKTALVLGNRESSLLSDQRHYKAIHDRENYFPSPAVFVYTLPNIMLGEICIKYKITGENSCFMMEQMDTGFLHSYVSHLMDIEGYEHCITGFVNYGETDYMAELYLIERSQSHALKDGWSFDEDFNQKN